MTTPRIAPKKDLHMMATRLLPVLRSLIRSGYFTLEVQGAEHLPRKGPVVFVANHAGWFTLDSLLGALVMAEYAGLERMPFAAVQDELLKAPWLGPFFQGLGGFPASWLRNPKGLPPDMQIFMVYPEGTEGNCKPFWRAYRMKAWLSGFLRLAASRNAVIVPMAILGGEECLPVAATLRALKPVIGTILPIPLVGVPLPARWKFIFHEPIELEDVTALRRGYGYKAVEQRYHEIADEVRGLVQGTLDRETALSPLARLARLVERTAGPPVIYPRATERAFQKPRRAEAPRTSLSIAPA